MWVFLSIFEGDRGGWKSGAVSQPRAKFQARLLAGVPVLVVVRIALVSVIVVVRVGVHLVAPFYVRGLGLDVPGEGVIITAVRPMDERPGRLRRDGLGVRLLGFHGEAKSLSANVRRWGDGRRSGR